MLSFFAIFLTAADDIHNVSDYFWEGIDFVGNRGRVPLFYLNFELSHLMFALHRVIPGTALGWFAVHT